MSDIQSALREGLFASIRASSLGWGEGGFERQAYTTLVQKPAKSIRHKSESVPTDDVGAGYEYAAHVLQMWC